MPNLNSIPSVDSSDESAFYIVEITNFISYVKKYVSTNKDDNSNKFKKIILKNIDGWFKQNANHKDTVLWVFYKYIQFKFKEGRWKTASTLKAKLTKHTYQMIVTAGNFNVNELSPSDWESIYEESISLLNIPLDSNNYLNRLNFAKHFYTAFHLYMVKHEYAELIENSEVLNSDSTRSGNSNIICKDEYTLSYNYLCTLSHIYGHIYTARAIILCLAYKLGLRANEARCLCILEVTGFTDPFIALQVTKIRKGKTVNFIRNIPLLPLLSDYELNMLLRHREIQLQENNMDFSAPLFPSLDNIHKPIKESKVFPAITSLLKYITGDPTIRFQHLRQSFATRFIMFLTYEVGKDWEHLDQIKGIVDPIALRKVREYFFSSTVDIDPDLIDGAIYQLAKILGHSGPAVGFSFYTKSCELLKYLALNNRKSTISVKAAENILNMDKNARCNKNIHANKVGQKGRVELSEISTILKETMPLNTLPDEFHVKNHFEENNFNQFVTNLYPSADTLIETVSKLSCYMKSPINLEKSGNDALWLTAIENLWLMPSHQTRQKKDRFKRYPTIPLVHRDYFDMRSILQSLLNYLSIPENKEITIYWINAYLCQVTNSNYEFSFDSIDKAHDYLIFLESIGIYTTRLHLLHYPHPDNFDDNADVYEKWSNRLGIPLDQISSRGVGNVNLSQPEGRMSVIVQTKGYKVNKSQNSRKRHATSSFLCALHICALLLEVERLK